MVEWQPVCWCCGEAEIAPAAGAGGFGVTGNAREALWCQGSSSANLLLFLPACITLSVQKHFHQAVQGNLLWDWLLWGCPSASGGFGVRSRVLHGWNLTPVSIYHFRVRHRPVLDVGLEAKASNSSLVAFVYSAEDLKAASVLLQGSQRLVMPQAGCKQGMLRLMHKAVLNNFSSCPEETGLCSLLLHMMHSNGKSSAAPLPSLTSYTQ